MAVDIATLGIKVDASEADQGKLKLDALAQSGDKAQASARGLSNTSKALNGDLASTTGAANAAGASIGGMAGKASQAGGAMAGAGGAAASMADRVARLKASVDPLGAAQDRVNDEMREAATLYAAGAMQAEHYASTMATLNSRATDLAARQAAVNTRIMAGGAASRLTANEALNLSRQFADIGVTAAMGMNPLMILIQQGPQIADIMKTSGLGWRDLVREIALFFKIIEVVPAANAAVAASQATVAAANVATATTATAAAAAEQQLSFAFMEAGAASNAAAAGAGRAAAANASAAAGAQAEAGAMVTRLGVVGRLLGPLAILAGSVWLGFIAGARGANDTAREVQREFGFTENQMERLRDANTELGYSFGDVWAGIRAVVSGTLEDIFGPNYLATIESYWNSFLDYVISEVASAARAIIGELMGAYYAVINVWNALPRVMGNLVASTVNIVTNAVATMVNASIEGINGLIGMLPDWVTDRTGVITYRMQPTQMATTPGPSLGQEIGRGMDQGMAQYDAWAERSGGRFRQGRRDSRRNRLTEAAGDGDRARAGRRPRQSDEEREYEQAVRGAENYIQALQRETEALGQNELVTKRLETTRAQAEVTRAAAALGTVAAMENARRLTEQMAQAQEAWEVGMANEQLRLLTQALGDQADQLEHETRLIGLNNEARAVAIAQREIDIRLRDLERRGWSITPDLIQEETDRILGNARARGRLADATEAASRIATTMRDNANAIRDTTEAFGELFGTAGAGFANLLNTVMDYDARQAESRARLIQLQQEYNRGQMSEVEYTFQRQRVEDEMARASIANYGNMLSAAKTFFEEGSTGWRVLEAAERVYRLFQFAMQIRSMLMDRTSTASSVANSGARAAADGVAAIAKAIASLPFPLNLIAGAATAAALVAFGVKVLGGKGGGSSGSASAAKAVDAYTGPRDEYGAPTSSYSVLKPGAVRVGANDNSPASYGNANVGNTIVVHGDKLIIEGGADQRTVEQLKEMLDERDQKLVQETRQIVAQDNAERSARQRIGGA